MKNGGNNGTTAATAQTQPADQQKKKGFFGKILGVFKGDDNKDKKPQQQ
jgi:hypothetical protein